MNQLETENIINLVDRHLSWFEPKGKPQRLKGGNLNYVWRIEGKPRSIIFKYFAPHIAVAPEIPLDLQRMLIEARCLQAFSENGEFAPISNPEIRPPQIYYFDKEGHFLVIEDVETSSDNNSNNNWVFKYFSGQKAGEAIGNFIGNLHAISFKKEHLAKHFDNLVIQKTRLQLQYKAIGDLLEKAGISDFKILGKRVEKLGKKYLDKGQNLIMGDLWPRSILPTPQGLRIIDWELAHYGRPAQDLGHFAAHLWMMFHRAKEQQKIEIKNMLESFFISYNEALGERKYEILKPEEIIDCSIHFGAEILVRTIGRFQSGYLYDGLDLGDRIIREALETAALHIRSPEKLDTFSLLKYN